MKNNKGFVGLLFATITGLVLIALTVVIPIVGLHIQTGSGSHVGYITATETSGLFFPTHTAYVKTDTQSSQEDTYCVMDDNVLAELKLASASKEKVEVEYISYWSAGIKNCMGEGAIITGFSELKSNGEYK